VLVVAVMLGASLTWAAMAGARTLLGTNAADTLRGTDGPDSING